MTENKPCPFCGHAPSKDLIDTLYPTGGFWHDDELLGIRSYHPYQAEGDGRCWKFICNESEGGCGAQVRGDTVEETLAAWNRRADPLHILNRLSDGIGEVL